MRLTNRQILDINSAIVKLSDKPIAGTLKFKLLDIYTSLEPICNAIFKASKDQSEDEQQKILDLEKEVPFTPVTRQDLEPLDLSVKELYLLLPIVEEEGEKTIKESEEIKEKE